MRIRGSVIAIAATGVAILATDARAQDLDANKTPGQLFSQTCVACHRGPQGLSKGKPAGAIAGFLKQHYTSSARTAGELAAYLASVKGEPPRERGGRAGRQAATEPATPPRAATEPTAEKPKTAAERRKEREERRARAEDRAKKRAALTSDDAPRVKRPRRPGEPATVSTDPDPIITTAEPTPVFHDRALSRAQESRQWPAEPPAQPPAQATAPAAAPAGGAQTAAVQGGLAAAAPADAAPQGLSAPGAGTDGAAQSATPPIADHVFSTPLP